MKWFEKNALYIAFATALTASVGSLIFSDVLHFPPCVLCWYQRICMYPLVPILLVGIILKDKRVDLYALPMSLTGLLIAFYHNLLYYQILPQSASPCALGISCTTKFIEYFGFVTIPLLSFTAFAIITFSLILFRRSKHL